MKTQLTERKIQKVLSGFLSQPKYDIDGLFIFDWESDKLLETRAGYIYEFEIKISRADFKNDFKHKPEKHIILNSPFTHEKFLPKFWMYYEQKKKWEENFGRTLTVEEFEQQSKGMKSYFVEGHKLPNYFYYAVPEGMIQLEEVPQYAGLIYIPEPDGKYHPSYKIIKQAPLLHKKKYSDESLNLGEKFYYNMRSWKQSALDWMQRYDGKCEDLQEELDSKGHEKSYEQIKRELEAEEKKVNRYKEELAEHRVVMKNLVEGADYNNIERVMLIDEIEKHDPDFKYLEFLKTVEAKYIERYPDRA